MAYAECSRVVRSLVIAWGAVIAAARGEEAGFEPLFDGTSLAGWKASENGRLFPRHPRGAAAGG